MKRAEAARILKRWARLSNKRILWSGTVLVLVPLAGCVQTVGAKCPDLEEYTQLAQDTLAAELPKDGPESQVQIEDYIKLRQACRAQ